MRLKIGNFTVKDEDVVYTERDVVSVPETITLHLSNGETLVFEDDQAIELAGHFENQCTEFNI